MNKDDALAIMNRYFEYRSDGLIDTYRILKPGDFKGDCDDFAITLAHLIAGSVPKMLWKLLTRKMRVALWRHKTTGSQHVSLEVDGVTACNITRAWHMGNKLEAYGYERRMTVPLVVILPKFLVGLLKI